MNPILKKINWTHGVAAAAGVLITLAPDLVAHEDDAPPAGPGVRLQFLPPPMQGTISLGIYDAGNKLVRVLHREAPITEFVAAMDGLVTVWNGENDAGQEMPPGTYSARGYIVGDVAIAGEAFHFNDWIESETSPRIRRVVTLSWPPANRNATIVVQLADGSYAAAECDLQGKLTGMRATEAPVQEEPAGAGARKIQALASQEERQLGIADGKIVLREGGRWIDLELPSLHKAVDACWSGSNYLWVIDHGASGAEVKEYSRAGEFRRRLAIDPTEPAPVKIVAAPADDTIFLIEEDAELQRVRALELVRGEAGEKAASADQITSLWKVAFSRQIVFCDNLQAAWPKLGKLTKRVGTPETSTTVRLLPNELDPKADRSLTLVLQGDDTGTSLRTQDGLPLRRVSATTHLRWLVFARSPDTKAIAIFQSDGAMVEEYKVGRPANMMAFDCGNFDYPSSPPAP